MYLLNISINKYVTLIMNGDCSRYTVGGVDVLLLRYCLLEGSDCGASRLLLKLTSPSRLQLTQASRATRSAVVEDVVEVEMLREK